MTKNKKSILKQSVISILRPLAQLMLAHGLTYREFTDLAKISFFEAGLEMTHGAKSKLNQSHLSALTGLHRKDIARLIDQQSRKNTPKEKPRSLAGAVVAEWTTNHKYIGKDKLPLALPYKSDDSPSFSGLVESISKDIRPRALISELKRIDMISENNNGHLILSGSAYLPDHESEEKFLYFKRNLESHIAAASINMQTTPSPFFDRSAHHSYVDTKKLKLIRDLLEKDGMDLLKQSYKHAEASDRNASELNKMVVGIYMYTQENPEKPRDRE